MKNDYNKGVELAWDKIFFPLLSDMAWEYSNAPSRVDPLAVYFVGLKALNQFVKRYGARHESDFRSEAKEYLEKAIRQTFQHQTSCKEEVNPNDLITEITELTDSLLARSEVDLALMVPTGFECGSGSLEAIVCPLIFGAIEDATSKEANLIRIQNEEGGTRMLYVADYEMIWSHVFPADYFSAIDKFLLKDFENQRRLWVDLASSLGGISIRRRSGEIVIELHSPI